MPDAHPDEEVPEADRLEQQEPVVDEEDEDEGFRPPELGLEVPEADALEQAIEVGYADDEERP